MVEHRLPKPRVAGSSPVCRSIVCKKEIAMTPLLVVLLMVGFLLIATERVNHLNKAAVAVFTGVLCWLLYVAYGPSYVTAEHPEAFSAFLGDQPVSVELIRTFVARNVFLHYVTDACEIVLYLLATMAIVEVLNNNGCFDFIAEWLRTRSSSRFMWLLMGVTFLVSANLDNLTTVCMMLGVVHSLIATSRGRMLYGALVVIAANLGGAFTVIGDVTSLALWVKGVVTPTQYSLTLFLPCLVATVVTGLLVMRHLPSRLELVQSAPRYRSDDSRGGRTMRLMMLLIGIGGLWLIPTFHRLTHLSPFVGALCVLSLLWIVDELCNRKLLRSERMVFKRAPLALQYANVQTILFVIGVALAVGAVQETGGLRYVVDWCAQNVHNLYVLGVIMGVMSVWLDGIVVILTGISTFAPTPADNGDAYVAAFAPDGHFWPLLSYCTAVGSSVLTIGSMAGYSLMRMENVSLAWYVRFISGKVIVGALAGLIVFFIVTEWV